MLGVKLAILCRSGLKNRFGAFTPFDEAQDRGHRVIRSTQLPRLIRERLVRAGHLRLIIKHWYVPALNHLRSPTNVGNLRERHDFPTFPALK